MCNNKNHLIWLQERLKDLDSQISPLDLNRPNCTSLKLKPSPLRLVLERTILRGVITWDSSPPLNRPRPTKFWKPTLSTAYLTTLRYSSGRKIGPLWGTMWRINKQQMGPLYCSKRFQDTIQVNSPFFVTSGKSESIFLPVTMRRDRRTSPEMGSGKGTRSGNCT